ncbi:Major facilitator superfamily domain general substrate transporter [Penicillium vulpinum]|uniref:Major facilitator superfamily domain general substrate transporter n=1 Tax=Penicillium vulpinum TaxID=29845 RepID=UPI002546F953|nr:Major facilitator superfamily domain general substrate transporter [Penicillium vulpinum]KAJ5952464.1 Major facilitator superfamily domain general substrate transporter [Penicillium vulpinum]
MMASLSRSYPAIELDYTLGGDSDVTSLSSGDIDLTRPEILQIVLEADEFVTKYDLADIREIIRKGALLFYHPHNLAQIEEEMGYLENQGNSIKGPGKPPGSSVSIAICYAAMFLCDFLGSSAPIEVFYPRLDEGQPYLGSEGLWFWEYPKGFWETVLLYSLAPLVSALLGFWLSLSLNRYWGRRRAFSVAAALALVAIFDRFLCHDWEYLAIADIFARVATTMLNCTSFLYIAEISEASRRSSTVAKWYFGSSLLSMVAQFIYDPALLSFIISTLAACVVLGLSIQIPDSPYWLTLNGKVHEAHESLRSLRDTEIIAARDLYQIYILDGQSDLRNGNLTWPKPLPRLIESFQTSILDQWSLGKLSYQIWLSTQ